MRHRLTALASQTVVYGISGAAIQAVGILTVPVFSRTFTPTQYGVLEVASVGFSALLVIADSGLTSASQRSYYDYSEQQDAERRTALTTGLVMSIMLAAIIAGLLVAFAAPVAQWLFGDDGKADIVATVAVTIPVAMFAAFFREVMRLKFRAWRYTTSAVIGAAGSAAVGVIAVLAFDSGVEGVLLGTLMGSGLAALYGLAVTGRDVVGQFSHVELRRMLIYGLPLLPAAAALWGLALLDRVMLAKLGSLSATGDYAIAGRFSFAVMFCVTAFLTAYGPFQLSLWQEDRAQEAQVRGHVLTYTAVGLTLAGLVLALFAREITLVLAPAYTRSYQLVGLLALGVAVFGVATTAQTGISIARRTGYIAVFTTIAVSINAIANLVLIPPLGTFGAAIATLVAYIVLGVLYYRKAQELDPVPFAPRRVITVLVFGGLLMGVGAIPFSPIWLGLPFKLLALVIFAVGLPVLGVLHRDELREARTLFAQLRDSGAALARTQLARVRPAATR